MLQNGNQKVGKALYTWSIPAGMTCPGKTEACYRPCYARHGHSTWASTKESHLRNYQRSKQRGFAKAMIGALGRRGKGVVRIHVAGDFYSPAYARKWLEVVRACPDKVFLAYTRSWRVPAILEVLRELGAEKNVRLWFSCDHETGRPPAARRVRRAYMATSDADVPRYKVHLVFRVRPKSTMKFNPRGVFVCPTEQRVERQVKVTCSTCTLCWSRSQMPEAPERRLVQIG